jgi:hypothetical protein
MAHPESTCLCRYRCHGPALMDHCWFTPVSHTFLHSHAASELVRLAPSWCDHYSSRILYRDEHAPLPSSGHAQAFPGGHGVCACASNIGAFASCQLRKACHIWTWCRIVCNVYPFDRSTPQAGKTLFALTRVDLDRSIFGHAPIPASCGFEKAISIGPLEKANITNEALVMVHYQQ